MSQLSFTSWWIDNYLGWGQFRTPPTGPMPGSQQVVETKQEKSS